MNPVCPRERLSVRCGGFASATKQFPSEVLHPYSPLSLFIADHDHITFHISHLASHSSPTSVPRNGNVTSRKLLISHAGGFAECCSTASTFSGREDEWEGMEVTKDCNKVRIAMHTEL